MKKINLVFEIPIITTMTQVNLTKERDHVVTFSIRFFKAQEHSFGNDEVDEKEMRITSQLISKIYHNIYYRFGLENLAVFHNCVIDGLEAVGHRYTLPIPLDLVKKLSEIDNTAKKGTIFYFTIPIKKLNKMIQLMDSNLNSF